MRLFLAKLMKKRGVQKLLFGPLLIINKLSVIHGIWQTLYP